MPKFLSFKEENGGVTLVEEGSELHQALVDEGASLLVPALEQEVSTDGMTNTSPAIIKPRHDRVAGRYYLYSNGAWVTDCDDNYSTAYVLFNEQAGAGAEPIYEWEHVGEYYKAGEIIKDFTFTGRCNNSQLTDMEIRLVAKYPNDPDAWNTGFSGDTSVSIQTLFSGNYSDMGVPVGPRNNVTRGYIELNETIVQDSYVCMYIRRAGTLTGTRYFTGSRILGVL